MVKDVTPKKNLPAQLSGGKSSPTTGARGGSAGGGPARAGSSSAAHGVSARQMAQAQGGDGGSNAASALARAGRAIAARPVVAVAAVALVAVAVIVVISSQKPALEGVWTIEMNGTAQDGHGSNVCDSHATQQHEFDVTQDSNTTFSGPTDNGGLVNGQISGRMVSFQILVITADGCNDVTDLSGTLSGNAITGTYSGGDCTNGEYCTWEGSFTVDIQSGN